MGMEPDRFHPLTEKTMILKPITYIIILIASVLFWSGLSISSVKSKTLSRTEGLMGKTTQRVDSLAVASTYQAIKKQTETPRVKNESHPFKTTFFKLAKRIFSPDKRLQKRFFFRNILKL